MVLCHRLKRLLPFLLLSPALAYASKGLSAPRHDLSVQLGLGYGATTGTTNTRTLNSRDRVRYGKRLWRYTGRLSYNYVKSAGQVSANRVDINAKVARYLSGEKENFFLLAFRYDRNPFDGYRHYQVESVGAGHRIVRHGDMRLTAEGGVGFRQNFFLAGGSQNVPAVRVALNYRWKVGYKSIFSERLETLASTTGTLVSTTTGLTTPIHGSLALKMSEIVDHYTSPPAGFTSTSTYTTVDLIDSFT